MYIYITSTRITKCLITLDPHESRFQQQQPQSNISTKIRRNDKLSHRRTKENYLNGVVWLTWRAGNMRWTDTNCVGMYMEA